MKRDFSLFLKCLIPAILLTAVFAAVSFVAAFSACKGAEDVYTPAYVAVVDEEDSFLSRMLVSAVSDMDYISDLMEMHRCDLDTAMAALQSGQSAAVIVLPEGFVEDFTGGSVTNGQLILSEAAATNADVVLAAARFGEKFLASGQFGIFSGQQVIRDHGLSGDFHSDFLREMNIRLLNTAIDADSFYFTTHITGFAGTAMSGMAYYALCWLTLLLGLCGIFFTRLCTADLNRPMLCRLRACGIGGFSFTAGKILYPWVFRLVLFAAALGLLGGFIVLDLGLVPVLCALLALLLSSGLTACISMCVKNANAVIGSVWAAGLFACGGILPLQMLPKALVFVGRISPFGAAMVLLSPIFGGQVSVASGIAAMVYAGVGILLIRRRLLRLTVGGGD